MNNTATRIGDYVVRVGNIIRAEYQKDSNKTVVRVTNILSPFCWDKDDYIDIVIVGDKLTIIMEIMNTEYFE